MNTENLAEYLEHRHLNALKNTISPTYTVMWESLQTYNNHDSCGAPCTDMGGTAVAMCILNYPYQIGGWRGFSKPQVLQCISKCIYRTININTCIYLYAYLFDQWSHL